MVNSSTELIFIVKTKRKMPQIIRLSESEFKQIIAEAARIIVSEDGAMGGNAATPGATSASGDRVGAFDVPFGNVQRRSIYKPKEKDGKMKEVDINPALKRHDGKGGSISIPKE